MSLQIEEILRTDLMPWPMPLLCRFHREQLHSSHFLNCPRRPRPSPNSRKRRKNSQRSLAQHIRNGSHDDQKDLEDVILRALATSISQDRLPPYQSSIRPHHGSTKAQTGRGDVQSDALTKEDMLKATHALSKSIKRALSKRQQRPATFLAKVSKCEHCPVTVARPCDMRKHMKRHTRPYGCTFPKCHKRFGAKSDWKRHENSQHFQLESFRCQLPSPALKDPCGELFYRAEIFKTHLQAEHKMTDLGQVNHEVKMRRIGKNGQGQFWCGFCQKIVRLEKKRNEAWDERFDHIDNHFSKEGRGIGEWLCVEAKKLKGEVLKEVDRTYFDDEDADGGSSSDGNASPDVMQDQTVTSPGHRNSPILLVDGVPLEANISRKRLMRGDSPPSKRRREVSRYCVSSPLRNPQKEY